MLKVKIKSFKGTSFELEDDKESKYSILSYGDGYEKHNKTELFMESIKGVFVNIAELEKESLI